MDMKLKSDLIVRYRKDRAWSQHHLAEVCGLSLRTIQRVENTGIGSYETLRALASSFDVDLKVITQGGSEQSVIEVEGNTRGHKKGRLLVFCSLVLSFFIGGFIASSATALPSLEVMSRSVQILEDRKVVYVDDVIITVPAEVSFELSTTHNALINNDSGIYKLALTVNDLGTLLLSDASVTRTDEGVRIETQQAKWRDKSSS